jgi:hypothetical protein
MGSVTFSLPIFFQYGISFTREYNTRNVQTLMRSLIRVSIVFLMIAFGVSLSTAQNKDSQLSTKYDKKKDETTLKLKQLKLSPVVQQDQFADKIPLHQVILDVSTTFAGQQPSKPVDVELHFQISSSNYIMLRSQAAMAVLDKANSANARAISLGPSDYKSHPPKFNSVYEETLVVKTPAEALVKMANAKSISLYLGPIEYPLSDKNIAALKELAAELSRAGTAAAATPK